MLAGEDNSARFNSTATPRETLRSILSAANEAVYEGNVAAMRFANRLLAFEGGAADTREETLRRNLLWDIVDLSTFRLREAPAEIDGDEATFTISPAGSGEGFDLRFVRRSAGWRILVPGKEKLQRDLDRVLEALGHTSVEDLADARSDSPRGALRRFILGTHDWHASGKALALAQVNLSFLPAQLYDIQAPVLADYLKRVLDRTGFAFWQEIPDDPDRPTPYEHYRHPEGAVVIAREPAEDGAEGRWLFTANTMRGAPDLFTAMQDLPVAEGIKSRQAFTDFFRLREEIRLRAPALLTRYGLLEAWQWIALAGAAVAALVTGWLAGRGVTGLLRWIVARGHIGIEPDAIRSLDWPLRVAVAGTAGIFAFGWLGLAQTALEEVSLVITFLTTLATALLLFRIVSVVGTHLRHRAEETPGVMDQIFVSLVAGLMQLAIVIGGVVALAEIMGLPYEGVITGLGVGGIALAFAARDTVSNLLGGAILMADRPFKQGDMIETDQGLSTVETVGLRSTRLRTLDDSLLIIPNAQLSDRAIFNWGRRRKRKLVLQIGLTYDTPRDRLDRFVERLREVYQAQDRADETSGWIGMTGFGPSSIDIELWGYFRVFTYDMYVEARHALMGDIVDLAREIGVSFAFPTRTVHVTAEGPPAEARPLPRPAAATASSSGAGPDAGDAAAEVEPGHASAQARAAE